MSENLVTFLVRLRWQIVGSPLVHRDYSGSVHSHRGYTKQKKTGTRLLYGPIWTGESDPWWPVPLFGDTVNREQDLFSTGFHDYQVSLLILKLMSSGRWRNGEVSWKIGSRTKRFTRREFDKYDFTRLLLWFSVSGIEDRQHPNRGNQVPQTHVRRNRVQVNKFRQFQCLNWPKERTESRVVVDLLRRWTTIVSGTYPEIWSLVV